MNISSFWYSWGASTILAAVAASLTLASKGHDKLVPRQVLGQSPLTAKSLSDRVQVIHGDPGGNVLVIRGPAGVVLVDAQSADVADSLRMVVKRVAPGSIRAVINTHYHEDHIAGNSLFRGVGAKIVAHRNVPIRAAVDTIIEELEWHREPADANDLPTLTVANDTIMMLGGSRIGVLAFPAAHTDGDLAVYLPDDNVLHTGDIVEVDAFPFIDWWGGGSLAGTIAAVDRLLQVTDDATRIVPGHGRVVDRAHLRDYRDMLVQVGARVGASLSRGETLETTMRAGHAVEFAAGRGGEGAARRFVGVLYLGLRRGLR